MSCNGPKKGLISLVQVPQMVYDHFWKNTFLTHFRPIFFIPKQPMCKAFWHFRRAYSGHHELKTRQKHLFEHSMWSTIIFERSHSGVCFGPKKAVFGPKLQVLKWRSGACDARS